MRVMAAIGLALCLATLITCNNNSNDNPPPTIATTKDNVCDQVAAVACYDLYACCTQGQIERALSLTDPEPISQCKDDVKKACIVALAGPLNSVTQGRATFSGAAMDACLKALAAPDGQCATIGMAEPWVTACMTSAFVGTVADGSQCNFAFECASATSTCAPDQTCTPLPTQGQPCATGCAMGFYCNGGTCATQLPSGAACTGFGQCQKDLFCDLSQPTPTCTALRDSGQPCDGNQACKNNQCLPGTCQGLGFSCFDNATCGMRCSNSTFTSCTTNCSLTGGGCGFGRCSVSGASCCVTGDCGTTGGTCSTPPGTCQAVPCVGDVVCANVELTVDYCTAGGDVLTLIGGG